MPKKPKFIGTNNPRLNRQNWGIQEVRKRLELGEELSTLKQVADRGGWRLPVHIERLKNRDGMPIISYRKPGFGTCAFYRLAPEGNRQLDMFGAGDAAPKNIEV